MSILAAATGAGKAGVNALFLLAALIAAWFVLDYFFGRRIGGKKPGSEKDIVGAMIFLAAVFVGILLATRRH